jgi:hypothetical protein
MLRDSSWHNLLNRIENMKEWADKSDSKFAEIVDILANAYIDNNEFDENEIEDWVHDNWEDYLSNDLIDEMYRRIDVASVIDSQCYGGGGFEEKRNLEIAVRDKVLELLF